VLENITFKKRTVSEETLKWAIEGMQLKEFIKSLPQGQALFQKENSCHRLMLKNYYWLEVLLVTQDFIL
jgi:ABC-type transport system involved in Fe-S cluster assembly fused permease/ATPase subunit